jgi:isopentenyl diphosphate isomerase/L-lactate dehydrogenase-like FMN-dependent dehydrogenase
VRDASGPDEVAARLAGIVSLADFEPLARALMEPSAFDYVAGGSWDEVTLHENVTAWRRRRFRPRVLIDVSGVDPSSTFLGQPSALPVAVAPMAFQSLAHPDGEIEAARGAAAAGIPYTLSTTSSHSIEAVAAGAPGGTLWFQLYTQSDPAITRSLVERAEAAGYRAIILTVDLPVLGYRDRDRRGGFLLPHMGNFADVRATHGRTPTLLHAPGMEPTLTWSDLATIRSWTSLPLVLKGIMTAEDGRLAVEHGVDAIVVSNHGARQLDRVPATVDVLAEVVAAVGTGTEVWVDGGVRRGLDVAIARALGAQGVLVGRPVYWALATGGAAGVERAIAIVREEFALALALLGTPTPDQIGPVHLVG